MYKKATPHAICTVGWFLENIGIHLFLDQYESLYFLEAVDLRIERLLCFWMMWLG
jgi:hypothetical protein